MCLVLLQWRSKTHLQGSNLSFNSLPFKVAMNDYRTTQQKKKKW